MKRIVCAGLFVCLAGAATAGGPVIPVMEPTVIEAETASSGGDNWVGIALTALVIIAAVTANPVTPY